MDLNELFENVDALTQLLKVANVPEKYVKRVKLAYVVLVTGTEEELNALYKAFHQKD